MDQLTHGTPETPPPDTDEADLAESSGELFATVPTGVELCYETWGDPSGGEPLLLLMGLSSPLTWWDPEFCSMLVRRGFFVITMDNRDVGRSTKLPERVTRGMLVRAFISGGRTKAPYSLTDMAQDALGLLDHLGIDSAHVVGVSMGGMIAQTVALEAPARVRSLTSIMSTTGKRTVGWQDVRVMPLMLQPMRPGLEGYESSSLAVWRVIGSPGYPRTDERTRQIARETFERGISASGSLRQMMAILTQPNRSPHLRSLTMPALVIHGLSDRMVHVSGGRDTASAIPGAELLLIEGMGHDLPPELFETYVDAIAGVAGRAQRAAGSRSSG
jgi:pimeloyl-ACP methyl ester carboxylesterase